jgi:hypothetical protein
MSTRFMGAAPLGLAFALSCPLASVTVSDALAHCFVGARFLPATLTVDGHAAPPGGPAINGFQNLETSFSISS